MNEPCFLSAVEARARIADKSLSPVALLDSCIAQIERTNPVVNAVVATCFERARAEAIAAEALALKGEALPPLHGLPVLIKDLRDTE
ncbi:MAG: amidase family protein, partial [Proteobacteria bacterium]|nr:amidase family protein [Pseudomonadota bacterium]